VPGLPYSISDAKLGNRRNRFMDTMCPFDVSAGSSTLAAG
jgi:hypothetical protein